MLLFSIQFPGHTLLLPASLCSLKFTELPPDCKSSPPSKKKKVIWWADFLSHTSHTNHLIISWCGLVYCRDVMATEEPQYLTVLPLAFLHRKQSLGWKKLCRHLKLNFLSPPFYHYCNLPCQFHPTLIQDSLPEITLKQISYSSIEPSKETLWN